MKEKKRSQFIVLMVLCVVEMGLVNTVPLWSHSTKGVILDTWTNILWAANLSIVVRLCGYATLAIRRPGRLYWVVQTVNTAVSLVSIVVFLVVFPMDFRPISLGWINTALRVLVIFCLAMGAISVAVNATRAVKGS